MTPSDLFDYPERLLRSLAALDSIVETRSWGHPGNPTSRLDVVLDLLAAALGREPFHSGGRAVESPRQLFDEAAGVNAEQVLYLGSEAPGLREWLRLWLRFENVLAARVVELVNGTEGDLTSAVLSWEDYAAGDTFEPSRGGGTS